MTAIEIMNGRPESGSYKVDVSRGGHDGRVSSEWFSRPDDEKYLSLSDLYASVKGHAERSRTRTVESATIRRSWRSSYRTRMRRSRRPIGASTNLRASWAHRRHICVNSRHRSRALTCNTASPTTAPSRLPLR